MWKITFWAYSGKMQKSARLSQTHVMYIAF